MLKETFNKEVKALRKSGDFIQWKLDNFHSLTTKQQKRIRDEESKWNKSKTL